MISLETSIALGNSMVKQYRRLSEYEFNYLARHSNNILNSLDEHQQVDKLTIDAYNEDISRRFSFSQSVFARKVARDNFMAFVDALNDYVDNPTDELALKAIAITKEPIPSVVDEKREQLTQWKQSHPRLAKFIPSKQESAVSSQ